MSTSVKFLKRLGIKTFKLRLVQFTCAPGTKIFVEFPKPNACHIARVPGVLWNRLLGAAGRISTGWPRIGLAFCEANP
jgi:hypothetical protein